MTGGLTHSTFYILSIINAQSGTVPGADGWGRVGGSGQLSGGSGRTLTSRSRHGRLLGGGDV